MRHRTPDSNFCSLRPSNPFAILLALGVAILSGVPVADRAAAAEPNGSATIYIVRVAVHDRENEIPRLAELQLDLAGIDTKAQTADFVVSREDILRLEAAGFSPEIVQSFEAGGAVPAPGAPPAPPALADYLDPAETNSKLAAYAAAYPSLVKLVQISTTEQGRPEYAVKISDNVNAEEDEPAIFFVGQHHAREVMTPEISTDLVDYLLTRYGTDAKVKHWVDANEIWVVASHNPDGTNVVFTSNSLWRKNMRDNGNGTFGVDPNRNYPFKWGSCGGSSGITSDDTYRGPSPASEPETQGIMALASAQHPIMNMSYHTYSELAIQPYGCTGSYTSENRVFRDLASDVGAHMPNDASNGWYSAGTGWELLYAVDGEMNDWFYGQLGSYGLTVEANSSSQGFQPVYATWRDSTVLRNRIGWQYLLDRLEASGITEHVTDACTGSPLAATNLLDEVVFVNGEAPRVSEPVFGRYTWLTVPGLYHVNVAQPGYTTQDWPVDVGYQMVSKAIRLVPAGSFAAEFASMTVSDTSGDNDGQLDPGETAALSLSVTATGGALSGLTAILSSSDPSVSITQPAVTFGAVPAGGTVTSTGLQPVILVYPQAIDGREILLTLTFSAAQGLCSPVSTFPARVTIGAPSCPAISQPLNTNPGWAISNSDGLGWAFGAPLGGGGAAGPSAAKTGSNVFGTNLSGNYGNSASYTLTTTAFDISNLRNVELSYWRWLNNESGWDLATVEASTDNLVWTEVWRGFGYDTGWELHRHDLSSLANGRNSLYLRFRLTSDTNTVGSGWYLDDISICGEVLAPAPRFTLVSSSISDAVKLSCSDHDSFADGGEIADLTVNLRNDGTQTAAGAEAFVTSANPDLGLVTVRRTLGNVAPGATAPATFRFKVADAVACREAAAITIHTTANSGASTGTAGSVNLILEASGGTPVPDTTDDFETNHGWTFDAQWQMAAPSAKGGSTATGGAGGKDPAAAFAGTKVLGLDLTGLGTSLGNYENTSAGTTTMATSPVYDCSNATTVLVSFRRWLCVESSTADKATLEVFSGTSWNPVWTNSGADLSDASWQLVSYDISPWAAGKSNVQLRYTVKPNVSRAFCGWNVDNLVVGNGYTPQICDAGSCGAGCTPLSEASTLLGTRSLAGDLFSWTPSIDPCRESSGGPSYRIYRATMAPPAISPVGAWPADTFFVDVSGRDLDGSASNTSYKEPEEPLPGQAFFYLVVVMGSNGVEGPVGAYGK